MTTPTIFETCRPRRDVLSGAVADADFAAHFASVVSRVRSPVHHDPDCPADPDTNTESQWWREQ